MSKLLIVDDEKNIRTHLATFFEAGLRGDVAARYVRNRTRV